MVDKFHAHFCRQLIRHCEPGLVWRRTSKGYMVAGRDKTNPQPALDFAASLLTEKNILQETVNGHLTNSPVGISVNDKRGANGHGQTKVLVFDLDDHDKRIGKEFESAETSTRLLSMKRIAEDIVAALSERGIRAFTVVSGGGCGVHVWALFKEFAYSQKVSSWGARLLSEIERDVALVSGTGGVAADDGRHYIEVFPKGPGHVNLALPLARKSYLYMSDGTGGFTTYDALDYEDRQRAYRAIFNNLNDWPADLNTTSPVAPKSSAQGPTPKAKQRTRRGSTQLVNSIDYRAAFLAFASQNEWREFDGWIATTGRVAAAAKDDSHFANVAYELWADRSQQEEDKWDDESSAHWSSIFEAPKAPPQLFWFDAFRGGYRGPTPYQNVGNAVDFPVPEPQEETEDWLYGNAVAMALRGVGYDLIVERLRELSAAFKEPVPVDDDSDLDQRVRALRISQKPSLRYSDVSMINRLMGEYDPGEGTPGYVDFETKSVRNYAGAKSYSSRKGFVELLDGWRLDPHRKVFTSITICEPGTERDFEFNCWRGFSSQPADESELGWFLELLEWACPDEPGLIEWLTHWIADIIQRPWCRSVGTAVMMAGPQGAGKSMIGEIVRAMIGTDHSLRISDSVRITQQFNTLVKGKSFIQCDEAFFARSRREASFLKSFITDDDLIIEPKGVAPYRVPQIHRLYATTNDVAALKLTERDRRWTVIDCRPTHPEGTQDAATFFKSIAEKRDDKNALARLHRALLNLQVDQDLIRKPYTTAGKREREVAGDAFMNFLVECLRDGAFPGDFNGEGQVATETVSTEMKRMDQYSGHEPTSIGMRFRDELRNIFETKANVYVVTGEALDRAVDADGSSHTVNKAKLKRGRGWVAVGTLGEVRRVFREMTGVDCGDETATRFERWKAPTLGIPDSAMESAQERVERKERELRDAQSHQLFEESVADDTIPF